MIGEPAPDFTLPAVHREGEISLADYRGKSHLLLAIFIGLYCPFCRRNIAQLGGATEKLRGLGVETLAVVATELDNARLYFKYRPARIAVAADQDLVTHRAFGLPRRNVTDELMKDYASLPVNPTGEAPEPIPMAKLGPLLDQVDGYQRNDSDRRDIERQWPQLKGQFLIDRDGIVRWESVELPTDGVAEVGKFPSDDELLAAAGSIKSMP
jgi:peroxiredoxin